MALFGRIDFIWLNSKVSTRSGKTLSTPHGLFSHFHSSCHSADQAGLAIPSFADTDGTIRLVNIWPLGPSRANIDLNKMGP